jgi:hypothetical protein
MKLICLTIKTVDKIRKVEMENCTTKSSFRKGDLLEPTPEPPFRTFTGLKEDKKNAGYDPEKSPTKMVMPNKGIRIEEVKNSPKVKFISVRMLKRGRANLISNSAQIEEITLIKTASLKNCRMSCFLFAPTTFLTPISLMRFPDRAVVRFMKFTQAIIRIKRAMKEKAYRYLGSVSPVHFRFR